VLGGEPVVGHEHARVGGGGQRAGQVPVAEGGAHHVAAAVEQQDRRGQLLPWREQERRHPTGDHRSYRHPGGHLELPVQLLAGIAQRLQVGARGGEGVQGFPGRGQPALEVAADGTGGEDRVVQIGDQAPRAVEQRVAGQRQLDPMRGAAQQVAADEPFQAADLPAQGGLGHEQPGRGAPEVELLGDRNERTQVPQLDRVRGGWEHEHLATALLRAVIHDRHHGRDGRSVVMHPVHCRHA
jgi:hypothetical protein